ncbi:hypothetical protein BUMB_01754 [Candidatus Paraburkholderia calva]|nr:hypothetical protein BUMB_01754 [Candidatus Paraburkholderia calva]
MKTVRSTASRRETPRRPGLLTRLLHSNRGSATSKFVILVPLMILILTGFAEIYCYLCAVSIVEYTAFMLADSLGQLPQIVNDNSTSNANNLGALWSAATLLAMPNDLTSGGAVIITSICDGSPTSCVTPPQTPSLNPGIAVIHWQKGAPWNAGDLDTRITSSNVVPSGWPFRVGDSAVVVEVIYKFNPFAMTAAFWPDALGTQTIYERVYVRPRTGYPLDLVG